MNNLEYAVSLRDTRIVRGGVEIVPSLTLDIPTGTVFGMVGPSGSGKTTIMRTILGLTRLAGGAATVLGKPAGDASLRRRIGYMPQGSGVYPDLSGRENLEFFASVYRAPRHRIDEVLELMNLVRIADRPLATYSGGETQRIGLAMALMHQPELMVLDEPTVGLDPRIRRTLWDHFREWAAQGTTLIVSTHVMDEADRCHAIAFIESGMLVTVGSPEELRARTGYADLESAILALSDGEEVPNVA
jgi:ABC-type multidrug transport system ATPase subunit